MSGDRYLLARLQPTQAAGASLCAGPVSSS